MRDQKKYIVKVQNQELYYYGRWSGIIPVYGNRSEASIMSLEDATRLKSIIESNFKSKIELIEVERENDN